MVDAAALGWQIKKNETHPILASFAHQVKAGKANRRGNRPYNPTRLL